MTTNTLPKIAAAYIRVSTDDQVEYSPPTPSWWRSASMPPPTAMSSPMSSSSWMRGISGKHTEKRPEFNRMIGTAKQKPRPFDAILLWKFSRFARNREDSIVYKSMLRRSWALRSSPSANPWPTTK